MPVHFKVANHPATPVPKPKSILQSPDELLHQTWGVKSKTERNAGLLQSSFVDQDFSVVQPMMNGFVNSIRRAYSDHHHLIIRPDDVWIAILGQFNFYVNAHSEELRSSFVQHEGKKELVIYATGSRFDVDFGMMSRQMVDEVHDNLVDKSLLEWIIPDFTTTTKNDIVTSAVMMMATLKSYFDYKFCLLCGIPSVTLQGEKSDWVTILSRLSKLESFGPEPKAWAALLRPILTRFIKAFDGDPDIDFWNHACHRHPQGSGDTELSGWITAFCVWKSDGTWQGPSLLNQPSPSSWIRIQTFELDNIQYPLIGESDVPNGFCQVDVELDDNGEEFNCLMVAGHLAGLVTGEEKDTLQPLPSWFMFVKESIDPSRK